MLENIERCLKPKCVEEGGVIYITLPPTIGRTGEEWIAHFGRKINSWTKSLLRSKEFQSTTGVIYNVAILRDMLWCNNERLTKNIMEDAHAGKFTQGQQLSDPYAEVACLISDYFSKEEILTMGLNWIVAMHASIEDSAGDPSLLLAFGQGARISLGTVNGHILRTWNRGYGFAFVLSQISTLAEDPRL